MASDTRSPGEAQTTRRVKYGLNVLVAILACAAIMILLNWISYRHYRRWDLTATRQYSLSPQTRKVVADLKDPYKLVTLMGAGEAVDEQLKTFVEQAKDLVDEYGRFSSKLSVDHINPNRDVARLEIFYGELRQRYSDQTKPLEEAVQLGRQAMREINGQSQAQIAVLKLLMEDPQLQGQLRQFVQSVARVFAQFDPQFAELDKQLDQELGQSLPDYDKVLAALKTNLASLNENLDTIVSNFNQAIESRDTPAAVKERLIQLNQLFIKGRDGIKLPLQKLEAIPGGGEYSQLCSQLASKGQAMVLVGPKQVRVIGLEEVFRRADPAQVQQGQKPQMRFLGEEKLTGALISMSMVHKPLVVLVATGQQPALGQGGTYEVVATRLRNLNFDVREWNPSGRPGPFGQQMPPGPMPQATPGQKTVWVVLKSEPNPMNPMGQQGEQEALMKVHERMEQGDAAMLFTAASPMAMGMMGGGDPVQEMVQPYGIKVHTDRLILRQVEMPDHQTRVVNSLDLHQWPKDLPITSALSGMAGVLVWASPIDIEPTQDKDLKRYPLMTVEGQGLWAQDNLMNLKDAKYDPAKAQKSFTVAVAAETTKNRVIVFADPNWATDQITNYGMLGPGSAEMFGAQFPANAELFVNSVYWLAGLDQLIAAGARAQDIRRVEPMEMGHLTTLRLTLLAGMPLLIGLTGVSVWLVRRRS